MKLAQMAKTVTGGGVHSLCLVVLTNTLKGIKKS